MAILLIAALVVTIAWHHAGERNHYLDPFGAIGHLGLHASENYISATHDWSATCKDHGFAPFRRPRKVYDLVLCSTELDWLEIRLHTHDAFVDYFVIIESPTTFTNKAKPLHLQANWDRFHQFHHKIIYKVVTDPVVSSRHWDHEDYLRNALLYDVFPSLADTPQAAQQHDVLVVSDMDELLRPATFLLLRYCKIPARLTLRTHFYYYSFQWQHRGEQWPHPQASTFGSSIRNTIGPNDLRQNLLGPGLAPIASFRRWWNSATLWNAGWHCSSCFSSIAEFRTKMASFSHQGWNTRDNRNAATLVDRVRNGLDLYGRQGEYYDKVGDNQDVPNYILAAFARDQRFRYLLSRDAQNASFEDWTPELVRAPEQAAR